MEGKFKLLEKMWADMGYQSTELKKYIKTVYGIELEIVKRPSCRFWIHKDTPIDQLPMREPGFKIQPRRWVVERTIAWINRNRRASKEYDYLTCTSENWICLAMVRLMLRRLYA